MCWGRNKQNKVCQPSFSLDARILKTTSTKLVLILLISKTISCFMLLTSSNCFLFIMSSFINCHICSVANTAVHPPNWATLKSPAVGQKTVGRVAKNWATFHSSTCGSSFFFKFACFLSIQKVLEPFQCPRTFFSSISGIIDILESNQYRLSTSHRSQQSHCFSFHLGWFWLFYGWEAPKFGKLGV